MRRRIVYVIGNVVPTMGKASRFLPTLALFLALSILVGSSSGSSSGLFFHHTIEVEDAQSGKRTVELDSQGYVYATFESRLLKLDSEGSIPSDHQFASEILQQLSRLMVQNSQLPHEHLRQDWIQCMSYLRAI